MLVDPDLLRAFAGQVEIASSIVVEADVGTKASISADGLPGSTLQWAARLVSGHVAEEAKLIASEMTEMGNAVRGAGNTYEVTDADLARSLEGIF
ncbi:hypothetical protein NIIDNTM18_53440 [Mycolicibacterium litorale]|uniref:Excreted virulence factor EspC (Type VII ESX diderm) n=1 Tax=Mycolicibacterium litorale TaxID=758802 RepID=A0A6S6PDM2_9MYCO|nr:hypothetical protein NIIDNTM18_53440 [Mycolicibacterium litorale]